MENDHEEEDLENDSTYCFLRDLSLPAEPTVVEKVPIRKRIKVERQDWRPINKIAAPPECFDLDSGEDLTAHQRDISATSINDTNSSETGNDSQSMRQIHVAAAVWDVIDPQGAVRGLSVSIPEAPVFSTGMVSPEDKSKKMDKVSLVSSNKKIRYSRCVLYPPHSGNIPRPTVDRPFGCKTVSITGVPWKMRDDMLREIFRDCGRIHKIKQKKHDLFYVTFSTESSIDKALQFNGYTVVTKDRYGKSYKGMMQVDFVPVWQEQQEYGHRMHAIQNEFEPNNGISASPVPTYLNFSEAAIIMLVEQLRGEDTFKESVNQFILWMEEGRCNRRNSSQFFCVLQAMQSFVSRLMKDTAELEEEALQHQCRLSGKYATNSLHFVELLKVFNVASSQTVWDHFTDGQQYRIDMWKKHIEEIKESNSRDLISGQKINLTDNGSSAENSQQTEELKRLQKENERLKKELKVAQREGVGRNRSQKDCSPDKIKNCKHHQSKNSEIQDNRTVSDDGVRILEKEARLIAAIGAFLNFHRFGESIECICKYLLKIDSTITIRDIEHLMRKFPTVFKEESVKEADDLKRKWTVLGF